MKVLATAVLLGVMLGGLLLNAELSPETGFAQEAGTVRAVRLDYDVGPPEARFLRGQIITLDRISGGFQQGADFGCEALHLHGTIIVDGTITLHDPSPDGCGYGLIVEVQRLVRGDVNGDGRVDLLDLAILGSVWGLRRNSQGFVAGADLDRSGDIGSPDLAILATNYGSGRAAGR